MFFDIASFASVIIFGLTHQALMDRALTVGQFNARIISVFVTAVVVGFLLAGLPRVQAFSVGLLIYGHRLLAFFAGVFYDSYKAKQARKKAERTVQEAKRSHIFFQGDKSR